MINISEIHDLKEAELLWRALSPNKTIFDEWDFRYCFYKYDPLPLCFLAAYDGEKLVGLLPLQKHPKHGYEFFAEDPCEENRPFIRGGYENIIPSLYAAMPGSGKAFDISGDDAFTSKLPLEDYKYVLPLAGLKSFTDFLTTRLSAKRRRSLVKEMEEAENYGIEAEIIGGESSAKDRVEALKSLFGFNVNNFKEESYLLEKDQAPWCDLMSLEFAWRIIVLKIKNISVAASLSVLHNHDWHYLITGANFKDYPGLGKLLAKININNAIAAGAKHFDAGLGDCGWKHLWHFDRQPQYEFIKEKHD